MIRLILLIPRIPSDPPQNLRTEHLAPNPSPFALNPLALPYRPPPLPRTPHYRPLALAPLEPSPRPQPLAFIIVYNPVG